MRLGVSRVIISSRNFQIKPKSWLKSVSAFANGVGGVLVFAVADDDTLVGLTNAKVDSEKISEAVKARIDPVPEVILSIHVEEGKHYPFCRKWTL